MLDKPIVIRPRRTPASGRPIDIRDEKTGL